jgi:N-acetylglucosaminyl-diphospho-decaprenol L-rhamnosyltransferase
MVVTEHEVWAVEQPQAGKKPQVRLQTPRLSVVIVNYHQWENTAALVRQLRSSRLMRSFEGEILIVDNHSPRHPLARQLRRCAGVSLRRWGRNRGFARAVNEGCRLSQGEWVLLLNPDMSLPEGFLDQVVALTDVLTITEPRTGILGFGLRNSDGSLQLSAGVFPTLLNTVLGLLVPRSQRKYRPRPLGCRGPVDWVTGCCLAIRRDCLEELGGLDPDYFLYYEDVDLCRRARSLGWHVYYEPRIQAVHHNPLHGRTVPDALRVVTRHSLLTYAKKHWASWPFWLLARLVLVEALLRKLGRLCVGDGKGAELFAELMRLSWDIGRGKLRAARRRLERLTRRERFTEVGENPRDTETPRKHREKSY